MVAHCAKKFDRLDQGQVGGIGKDDLGNFHHSVEGYASVYVLGQLGRAIECAGGGALRPTVSKKAPLARYTLGECTRSAEDIGGAAHIAGAALQPIAAQGPLLLGWVSAFGLARAGCCVAKGCTVFVGAALVPRWAAKRPQHHELRS
ncbi:hypothetical protein NS96R_09720 [Pseudomonas parafulva]|uniref:Uncharacterized protein n=1 Tax=Pseudomonas parafulva TaxID=157782 RepID=A0AAJ0LKC7_9PSED|nr:hypothetical protein NS96R_09720 [Pseudomonas parafulva]